MLHGLMSDAALAAERNEYLDRMRARGLTLLGLRAALRTDATSPSILDELRTVAHKLAGSAALYGFATVGRSATSLEDAIIERQADRGLPERVEADLDALVAAIEREQAAPSGAPDVDDTPTTAGGGEAST